jgi:hypothetical protein
MVVLGVCGESIVACRRVFQGYPASPAVSVTGALGAAAAEFGTAWSAADAAIRADADGFAARLTRSAALYAEADELVSSAAKQAS